MPREPVLPTDISGSWTGAYTLYDGTGRPLTDSLSFDIDSDLGDVAGEGARKRIVPDLPPAETPVEIKGAIVVNTFRLELIDRDTGNRAIFSGKVEGDTLAGSLSVDGVAMADLKMIARRR